MKHLIICREFPPAVGGGIATYAENISRIMAAHGETVHVIAQSCRSAAQALETRCNGRLMIHRIPYDHHTSAPHSRPHPQLKRVPDRALFQNGYSPQSFAWQACLLAEKLIVAENIDIIEGQEFEAPLYYLQLRRMLGLGPSPQPPIVVHLHTSTEIVARNNGSDIGHPFYQTAKRLEDFSINRADGLLCPSQFLADQIADQFQLSNDAIRVIPLPVSEFPHQARNNATWENGEICYVGRLEERKGVLEWIEGALTIARENPNASFQFIGSNELGDNEISGPELLDRMIPADYRTRFNFLGEQQRSAIPALLAKARIAVVPSRWENFPNTCIEAMSSGLPVIATRTGGMAEMIEDNRSGWLVERADSHLLAAALQRALETEPQQLATMGAHAAEAIRRKCDTATVLDQHLAFRAEVIDRYNRQQTEMIVNGMLQNGIHSEKPEKIKEVPAVTSSIAITVIGGSEKSLRQTLQHLQDQQQHYSSIIFVNTALQPLSGHLTAGNKHIQLINLPGATAIQAKNAALEAILSLEIPPAGVVFLNPGDRLSAGFLLTGQKILQHSPKIGLISGWFYNDAKAKHLKTFPNPAFPYQWLKNELASISIIRTEALQETDGFSPDLVSGYETWDLFNRIITNGWQAVTLPEIIGSCPGDAQRNISKNIDEHLNMRRIMLSHLPCKLNTQYSEMLLLSESRIAHSLHIDHLRLLDLLDRLRGNLGRKIIDPLFNFSTRLKRIFSH